MGVSLRLFYQLKDYTKLLNKKHLNKDWIEFVQKISEQIATYESKMKQMIRPVEPPISVSEHQDKAVDAQLVQKPSIKVETEVIECGRQNNAVYNVSILDSLKQRLSQPAEQVATKENSLVPKWKVASSSVKVSIQARTRDMINLVENAESLSSRLKRLEDLVEHLRKHSDSRVVAIKEGAVRRLLNVREKVKDHNVQCVLREAFALLGHVDPLPRRGIRILSIDGGGIRGIVVIDMLKKLEELTGKKIYELFDYICGVSTGSILVSLIGTPQGIRLEEASHVYKDFGTKLFTQSAFWGISNLVWSRAYYDTSMFENLLKQFLGEMPLIRTVREPDCPKLASISTVMNQKCIMPFVFRNYALPRDRQSQYLGSCDYTLFEAVRASGAAPTVFQEFCLDGIVHQDGGILVNNPCAVAIHEAKLLWPKSEIQCVVSCGTGRHAPLSVSSVSPKSDQDQFSTSWKTLFNKILDSATDTEAVHTMLNDLLPPNVYFRFNPYLTETVPMHEIRSEKISQLEEDAAMYIRKNGEKFVDAANTLLIPRTFIQKFQDFLDLKDLQFGVRSVTSKL